MALVGLYGFISANNGVRNNKEAPLNSVQGIIVNDLNIYIGLGFYNRIQKYDLQGNYLKCWHTDTYSKDFTFKVKTNGEPEILQRNVLRNTTKKLIESNEFGEEVTDIIQNLEGTNQLMNPTEYTDIQGDLYRFHDGFFKKLTKSSDGKEVVVITQTFMQNLYNGYSTPWSLGAFGILIFLLVNANIFTKHLSKGKENFNLLNTLVDIFK